MEKNITLLIELVNLALNELYNKDQYLIDHKVNERSIVFKFAHYLQNILDTYKEFADFDLDVEYNRNGNDSKRGPDFPNGAMPDVIIHKRGNNESNLLIIEFKSYWNEEISEDLKKLKGFTNHNGIYKYFMGMSIVLEKDRNSVRTKMLKDGNIIFF